MENTNVKPRSSREGENNPMFGRHHTDEAKQKQREAAIRRNKMYKKALEQQHHVSMDEFLQDNPTVEEYIKTIVKESIDRFIWNETKISR